MPVLKSRGRRNGSGQTVQNRLTAWYVSTKEQYLVLLEVISGVQQEAGRVSFGVLVEFLCRVNFTGGSFRRMEKDQVKT